MELDGQQFSHYRILHLIGQGNSGEVYLAEDLQIQQQVALKIVKVEAIHPDQKASANALRLFLRTITASSRLNHPNILPLYNYGEAELHGSQVAYLVMPYRPEGSLLTWLQQRAQNQPNRQLTAQQLIHIVRQAGAALQDAHERRIMHLDVKPANFLVHNRSTVDEYPDLLLSDFGVAYLAGSDQSSQITATYSSPEQHHGRPVFASDQYALGIMAYELLTGRPPFQGTPESVITAHRQAQPESVSDLLPLLPPTVDLVLQRALAKKPRQRFPSVAAFSEAFQEALQGVPAIALIPVSQTITAIPATPDIPDSHWDIRATLIISEQEAQNGAVRTLNLPNGNRINLQLPAGIQSEEVLFLQGQGEKPDPDTAPGNLYITLSVQTSAVQIPAELTDVTIPIRDFMPAHARTRPAVLTPPPTTPPFESMSPRDLSAASEQHDLSRRSSQALPPPVLPPGEPKHTNSRFVAFAMILLVLVGVGVSAYSTISSKLPFLQNSLQTPTTAPVVSVPSPVATTRTPQASSIWHPQVSGTSQQLIALTWADTRFVTVGSPGVILTSPDGHTWTTEKSGTTQGLWSVVWSGSLLVAVGTGGTILTSLDGHTWTAQKSGTTQDLWSVVYGDGFLFVATGTGGTILTSRDGHTWTLQHASTGQILDNITWSGKMYVVVGDNGTIFTSPDADTWTIQNSGTSQLLEDVTWANAQFVVVGANGTILTSPNGTTWTAQKSGTTQALDGVAWFASQFTVIGDNGTILVSPNGRTWTTQNSGTLQHLWGIARPNAQSVIVGNHGTILASP